MSDYTVELRKLVEGGYPINERWLKDYPIFNEEHRPALNNMILLSFWTREIGYETPDMFLFKLRVKMMQIMPYYNQVYLSAMGKFDDFLSNVDITTVSNELSAMRSESLNTESNTTRAQSGSKSVSATYQFPQTLVNEWNSANPNGEDYKSNEARSEAESSNTGSGQGTSESTGTDAGSRDVESHTKGMSGITRAQLISEYRELILNVDMLVVSELDSLFMQVWNPHPNLR